MLNVPLDCRQEAADTEGGRGRGGGTVSTGVSPLNLLRKPARDATASGNSYGSLQTT